MFILLCRTLTNPKDRANASFYGEQELESINTVYGSGLLATSRGHRQTPRIAANHAILECRRSPETECDDYDDQGTAFTRLKYTCLAALKDGGGFKDGPSFWDFAYAMLHNGYTEDGLPTPWGKFAEEWPDIAYGYRRDAAVITGISKGVITTRLAPNTDEPTEETNGGIESGAGGGIPGRSRRKRAHSTYLGDMRGVMHRTKKRICLAEAGEAAQDGTDGVAVKPCP